MLELRSANLEVVIDPGHGAEIVSLIDRRTSTSLLAASPRGRSTLIQGELTLEEWEAGYRGGWQVLTPNAGDACQLEGEAHGFHGRASTDPWTLESIDDSSVRLAWKGHSLRVVRRVVVDGTTLSVETSWSTNSLSPVPMINVEHLALGPAFLSHDVRVSMPGTQPNASEIDLRADTPASDFRVVGPFDKGLVEVVSEGDGPRAAIRWDASELPYLWFWHENLVPDGVFGPSGRVLGLEPASVRSEAGLARAVESGQATWISAGEVVTRKISLEIE